MKIPTNIFLKYVLETFGLIFFLTHDDFPQKRHPTILVGYDIDKDILYLVSGTSQVSKRRKYIQNIGFDIQTLVMSGPNESNSLTSPTAFDSNQVIEVSLSSFCSKIDSDDLKRLDTINTKTMKKIYNGIQLSTVVEPYIKEKVKKYFLDNVKGRN